MNACATPPIPKDFSYDSGERQTATRFDDIRVDHASRYLLAAMILKSGMTGSRLSGLDAFCGNGYGSWKLACETGASLLGLDGSEASIQIANQHYATPGTLFAHKLFPFQLPRAAFDFVTCFESIEHVDDPEGLFNVLCDSLKIGGALFLSTPNEDVMPLALNSVWFRHHTRHFREADVQALAQRRGDMQLAMKFGQDVYRLDDEGRVLGVKHDADMRPRQDLAAPHFIIHVYVRKGAA